MPVDCIIRLRMSTATVTRRCSISDPIGYFEGASTDACPVVAIASDCDLTSETLRYEEIDAAYHASRDPPIPGAEPRVAETARCRNAHC